MDTLPFARSLTRVWFCFALVVLLLPPALAAAQDDPGTTPLAAAASTIRTLPTSEPVVALTFDTNTVRGYTGDILDTLKTSGVRASFGVTGTFAANNPDLIKRMVAEGHHLMNHSWDHPWFTDISSSARASQLQRTHNLILDQVGVDVRPYFRPPGGYYDSSVLADLAANGYAYNVMWSVDAQGWRGKSAADITQQTVGAIHRGAIVLQHTFVAGDAGAVGPIIDQLRARGYRFATVADYYGGAPPPPPPPPSQLYFPETGHWLSHGFLAYWWNNGRVPVFGYPLTEEFTDPKSGLTVQYVERQRFEWHPDQAGTVYEVMLGRLGDELLKRQGRAWQEFPKADPAAPHYMAVTGHAIDPRFWEYWSTHGIEHGDPGTSFRESLALFGYPISGPMMETNADGHSVLTQYFERAVFEWHPDNPDPWKVLLRRLGAEMLARE